MIATRTANLSMAAAGACLLLLASLHLLSPEFDPSWRVVSEYANGQFPWVLSLMFAAWAISSWDLHHPLHDVAGALGVLRLPIAAMLISPALIRIPGWSDARSALLGTANLTWVVLVLMIGASMLVREEA